ncbi:hypothetical protein GCM10009087_02110 [Sphingomonas oligophenolica]|uniref:Uncharacterized protein n=1 Tax=Sphingomonas oligophenolica TaxID=301154 RepID=A0ABU9Y0Y3_9SPHN
MDFSILDPKGNVVATAYSAPEAKTKFRVGCGRFGKQTIFDRVGWREAGKTTFFASAGLHRLDGDARLFLFLDRRREWLYQLSASVTLRQFPPFIGGGGSLSPIDSGPIGE